MTLVVAPLILDGRHLRCYYNASRREQRSLFLTNKKTLMVKQRYRRSEALSARRPAIILWENLLVWILAALSPILLS